MQSDSRRAGQRSHAEAPALELHRSRGLSKSSPLSQLVWRVGPWATEEVVLCRALNAHQHAKFYGGEFYQRETRGIQEDGQGGGLANAMVLSGGEFKKMKVKQRLCQVAPQLREEEDREPCDLAHDHVCDHHHGNDPQPVFQR